MEKKIPDCIRSWTLGEGISMRVRHKFVRLISLIGCRIILVTGGGWGGTPLYKLYRYVHAAPSGSVFGPFWSENGYTLCPF